MASRDSDSESDVDSIDDDSCSESDITLNYHDNLADFSSGTDSDDDGNTQSSLGTFSSQVSDSDGDDFYDYRQIRGAGKSAKFDGGKKEIKCYSF